MPPAPGHAAALRDYCLSVIGGESVAPSLELELQTVAGEAAWVVDVSDESQLSYALEILMQDAELRRRYQESAMRRAREHFDIQGSVERLDVLRQHVLESA